MGLLFIVVQIMEPMLFNNYCQIGPAMPLIGVRASSGLGDYNHTQPVFRRQLLIPGIGKLVAAG
jgi:hypothetical protein